MSDVDKTFAQVFQDAVSEAYNQIPAAEYQRLFHALAKRVTVKSEPPPKKVWRVSLDLGYKLYEAVKTHTLATEIDAKYAADIIRERPDLVAAEWERRHRAIGYTDDLNVGIWRRRLFPELDP